MSLSSLVASSVKEGRSLGTSSQHCSISMYLEKERKNMKIYVDVLKISISTHRSRGASREKIEHLSQIGKCSPKPDRANRKKKSSSQCQEKQTHPKGNRRASSSSEGWIREQDLLTRRTSGFIPGTRVNNTGK
ncbi:hypothetical protein JTE90_013517 [Oedothorax gibbosus]|uniref:Uncharacterized protein n=1 Tax=Oedothorax gibbosus TaxID=931172 RepID=A0AAV6VKR2_9ARAC|nr:hypothetical protein JTE90_013517 [Oedothorax gibbosus]